MIAIYDGNNYTRVVLEKDITGLAPRTILSELLDPGRPVIWVWDGANGNKRRRDIHPEYKMNRTAPSPQIYAGFDMVAEVLKHTPTIQVRVPGYEADDVVAALTRHYTKAGEQVAIYSNDFDFSQLVAENPSQVFAGFRPKAHVPTDRAFYYKVCVGDPSDNIPGIKGFGDKTWEKTNPVRLKKFIDQVLLDGTMIEIDLPPAILNWVKDNIQTVQNYAKIIGFFDVHLDEISKHMTVGKADYSAADAYLKEFFQ